MRYRIALKPGATGPAVFVRGATSQGRHGIGDWSPRGTVRSFTGDRNWALAQIDGCKRWV